jgi:hypothetical protein
MEYPQSPDHRPFSPVSVTPLDSTVKQCRSSLFSTTRIPKLELSCFITRGIAPAHYSALLPLLSPPLVEDPPHRLAILIPFTSDTPIDKNPWHGSSLAQFDRSSRAIRPLFSPLECRYSSGVVANLCSRVGRGGFNPNSI